MIINSLNKINLDAIVHKTYKEAAVARGLSLDDQEMMIAWPRQHVIECHTNFDNSFLTYVQRGK